MPELPEVEVVKRSLEKRIKSLIIKKIKIYDGNLRYKVTKQDLSKILGLRLLKIKRRSKYLLFYFSKKVVVVFHLGMTGKCFIKKNNAKSKTSFYYQIEDLSNKHNRIEFILSNKIKLVYNDIRKFGFLKIIHIRNINELNHLKDLGPDPLTKNFSFRYFKNFLNGKKKSIKDMLMDQRCIAGLGNIYVNEILFKCKVKPTRKVNKLKDSEIKNIITVTKKILKKAIIFGGSSIKNFANSSGKVGNFQQHFNVYGKKDSMCSNTDCNGFVRRIVISNRASFFCTKCQKY